MNVLVSTGIFPNRTDGNRGVYVYKQVHALAQSHDVRVVAPVRYAPRWLKRYARFAGIPRRDTVGGLDVSYPRYVVIPGVARFLHGFFVYLCLLSEHRRRIRKRRPDVLLSYFAYPYGFAAVLTARSFGLPVVVSCRGSDINHLARPWIRRRLIGWALRGCDRVLAVSADLAGKIERLGVPRDRIDVVPNGIEPDRFRLIDAEEARRDLGLPPEGPVVVCVSRLSREKGIDLLLRAFASDTLRHARLWVVGDGAAEAELRVLHEALDLGDRVTLAGARPHDEIPLWMSAATVVAVPSRSEGHPNVVVEALASGRPVVGYGVGGVPEIINRESLGRVIPPENVEALADGIENACAREWDAEELRRSVSGRTWDRVADDLTAQLRIAAGAAGSGETPMVESK